MTGDGVMNRRRFLQSLAAVGVVVGMRTHGTAARLPARAPALAAARRRRRSASSGGGVITRRARVRRNDHVRCGGQGLQGARVERDDRDTGWPFGAETDQKFDIRDSCRRITAPTCSTPPAATC